MSFDDEKAQTVHNVEHNVGDKSRAGKVDDACWPLLRAINACDDFFTTSSCSGRLLLTRASRAQRGYAVDFLYCSHDAATDEPAVTTAAAAIWAAIEAAARALAPTHELALKMEAPIVAIKARSVDAAQRLLDTARVAGYKNAAIRRTTPSVMLSIADTAKLELVVAYDGALVVDTAYIEHCVRVGRRKLAKSHEKMARFVAEIERRLHR